MSIPSIFSGITVTCHDKVHAYLPAPRKACTRKTLYHETFELVPHIDFYQHNDWVGNLQFFNCIFT